MAGRQLTRNQVAVLVATREGGGHATIEDVMAATGLDRARVVSAMRSLARSGRVTFHNRALQEVVR